MIACDTSGNQPYILSSLRLAPGRNQRAWNGTVQDMHPYQCTGISTLALLPLSLHAIAQGLVKVATASAQGAS